MVAKSENHAIRREGYIPVVLYGRGVDSRALKVRLKDFDHILQTGAGRNNLIRLEIEGEKAAAEPPTVMIKDIQSDYVKGRHIHADLQQISLKEKIKAWVRIIVHGEDAISREGAIVQHQMRQVEVECLPTALPDHITVDLAGLGIGNAVTLGDLKVPADVALQGDRHSVVISIVAPKQVVEEVPAAVEGEVAEGAAPAEGAEAGKPGEEKKEKEAE